VGSPDVHTEIARSLLAAFVGREIIMRLRARDGHGLEGLCGSTDDRAQRGRVVIAQEMYAFNDYILSVCDLYAARGYAAAAPTLYDRKKPALEFPTTTKGAAKLNGTRQCLLEGW
jgi:dienelactone hydrolase